MAIDLEAIRRKLSQISGKNKQKDVLWKPEQDVTYNIRIVPFPDNDGQPFKERYFYYNIGNNPGLVAPYQFGKKDPFKELIENLRSDGTKESYELSKKIYPKMRSYAAIVVRGKEDEGVKLWAFGKQIYQNVLGLILDEEYGDITDIASGHDLKVTVTKPKGAEWAKTEVVPRPKKTPLADDPKDVKKILSTMPNVDDLFELKSYDELERILQAWLDSGSDTSNSKEGTFRGAKTEPAAVVTEQAAKAKPVAEVEDDLDAAFADLESE
jgi:hypothetical protein